MWRLSYLWSCYCGVELYTERNFLFQKIQAQGEVTFPRKKPKNPQKIKKSKGTTTTQTTCRKD